MHLRHGLQNLFRRLMLDQITRRPRLQRLKHKLAVLLDREHDHLPGRESEKRLRPFFGSSRRKEALII